MNTNVDGTSAKVIQFSDFSVVSGAEKETKKKGNYKVGEKQEVFPFRSDDDLKNMLAYFESHGKERDKMMFVVGINIGLRAGDLLSLKWEKIIDEGEITDGVTVKEEKTGKFRTFFFNDSCKKVLMAYFEKHTPDLTDYVFASQKGGSIDVRSAGKILKTAAKFVGIKYNVGTHSLRKTFGYHQLKAHNNDAMFVCQLQEMFGHSSPQITLRYCGLETEKLKQYYNDINLL